VVKCSKESVWRNLREKGEGDDLSNKAGFRVAEAGQTWGCKKGSGGIWPETASDLDLGSEDAWQHLSETSNPGNLKKLDTE